MTPRNVILVGPMGVGKTTVGRALARINGMSFVDSDLALEQRTGVSVSTIFDIEGEEGFRQRESELLKELARTGNSVIATGGGAVIVEENRKTLRSAGVVVYLSAPVQKLLKRTRNSRNRPLLQTHNPEQVLTDLMRVRDPLYRDVADLTVNVDDRSAQLIGRRIHEMITKYANT